MTETHPRVSILFVCLGNICRSPMAEAVFTHMVCINGYQDRFQSIDSAGTSGYHVDELPDRRTIKVCKKYGVTTGSLSQKLKIADYHYYDYIVAMDKSVLRSIKEIQPPSSKSLVKLFGDFADGRNVEDPYYGMEDGFEENFKQCVQYSVGLMRWLGLSPMKTLMLGTL